MVQIKDAIANIFSHCKMMSKLLDSQDNIKDMLLFENLLITTLQEVHQVSHTFKLKRLAIEDTLTADGRLGSPQRRDQINPQTLLYA